MDQEEEEVVVVLDLLIKEFHLDCSRYNSYIPVELE